MAAQIFDSRVGVAMEIPESMKSELGAWNNGGGIDLESWINGEGNFSLAVGYSAIYWPKFVEFEGYILREGFSQDSLRGFEANSKYTRLSIEWVMNHLHIADIHHFGCKDLTKDKIIHLGRVLGEIYRARLKTLFPEKPCTVEFHIPEDADDLVGFQISFWQTCHE